MSYRNNYGDYAEEKNTWSKQSDLHYLNWSPFDLGGWKREGYCGGGCGNKYNSSITEWTVAGNISPLNGNKEGYQSALSYQCAPGVKCQERGDTDCNIKRPFIPGGFLPVNKAYKYSK